MKCILFNKAETENNKLYSNLWSMQYFHQQFIFPSENIISEQLFVLEVSKSGYGSCQLRYRNALSVHKVTCC